MKKILQIADPEIRCYANYAHIFSILGANSNDYCAWIYNHYVQLHVPDTYETFAVDYMVGGMYNNTPNLLTSRVEREIAVNCGGGVIEFIKFVINKGYYVYMELDVGKIRAYNGTGMRFHDPLLFGYDDEKEEVYFADTYVEGKYSKGTASYKEIINAVGNSGNWSEFQVTTLGLDILCMRYRALDECFPFNKNTFIKLLNYYINEVDAHEFFGGIHGEASWKRKVNICGIGIYNILKKHLQHVKGCANTFVDKRGFYVILEHKKILEKSFVYLLGEEWNERYPFEAELMQSVIKNAAICLRLCLKYNITKDERILDKISEHAIMLEDTERVLIPNMIRIIESFNR